MNDDEFYSNYENFFIQIGDTTDHLDLAAALQRGGIINFGCYFQAGHSDAFKWCLVVGPDGRHHLDLTDDDCIKHVDMVEEILKKEYDLDYEQIDSLKPFIDGQVLLAKGGSYASYRDRQDRQKVKNRGDMGA